PSGYNEYEQAT
ncbi:unnamed protein product, partial [Didymodactylos carnosus]